MGKNLEIEAKEILQYLEPRILTYWSSAQRVITTRSNIYNEYMRHTRAAKKEKQHKHTHGRPVIATYAQRNRNIRRHTHTERH